MKTPNFDKQAEKVFITPVKKLKNINVIDMTGHGYVVLMPHTSFWERIRYHFILRIYHKPIVPEIQ